MAERDLTASPARIRRARLYDTVRTAHLERARQLPPATILYGGQRYDFDAALAAQVDVRRTSSWQAARLLGRDRVELLEINEPASFHSARRTATSLLWLGAGRWFLRRPRTTVVTYAIGNVNPFEATRPARLRPRLGDTLNRGLARYIWRRTDRIAFGTPAAADAYAESFSGMPDAATTIPALPAPCDCVTDDPRPPRVVFLGDLSERKGAPVVFGAWPAVAARLAEARLLVLGKGPLLEQAAALAESDPSVGLVVDPSRPQIHEALASARVLVLPSQPMPLWREQIGLPILEGLAHGCVVVTTDESGLAPWLRENGHYVVPGDGDPAKVADAIVEALSSGADPASVRSALPPVDGRLVADAWLFGDPDPRTAAGSNTHQGQPEPSQR
ncbi:MAG: glycosyltransferase family 4 protein [Brevundimonas sp.]